MANSEITAKLGLDTNSFKEGIEKAKQDFQKFGHDIKNAGAKHGANAGEQLTNALEHKLLGARHLSGALASALGLNIEKIAENIAAQITGGTAEAWKEVGKIQDHIGEMLERRDERRRSDLQNIVAFEKEILELAKQRDAVGKNRTPDFLEMLTTSDITLAKRKANGEGSQKTTAEDQAKIAEITAKQLELQDKITEAKERTRRTTEQEYQAELATKLAAAKEDEKINILLAEKVRLSHLASAPGASQDEQKERRKTIDENEKAIAEWSKSRREKEKKLNEEDAKGEIARYEKIKEFQESQLSGDRLLLQLKHDLMEAETNLLFANREQSDYQDLLNKKTEAQLRLVKEITAQSRAKAEKEAEQQHEQSVEGDKTKLTVQELANISQFGAGVSTQAGNESGAAREALGLKAKAEEARKMGNSDESASLMQQYKDKINDLKSVKDSEKDSGNALKQALDPTNKLITETNKILGGKFVTQ